MSAGSHLKASGPGKASRWYWKKRELETIIADRFNSVQYPYQNVFFPLCNPCAAAEDVEDRSPLTWFVGSKVCSWISCFRGVAGMTRPPEQLGTTRMTPTHPHQEFVSSVLMELGEIMDLLLKDGTG